MKQITNGIALAVTLAAWLWGVTTGQFLLPSLVMLGTWAVMKLAGQVDGYPFDWAVRAWRCRS